MVSNKPSQLSEAELSRAAPHPITKEELHLGAAVLTAPLAWALQLALAYGLVYPAARWQSKLSLYAVSIVAAAAALLSCWLGWRARARGQRDGAPEETRARTTFLGTFACGVGLFFFLAIVAQLVPATWLPLGVR